MGKEIERKFLVNGDFLPYVTDKINIVQGYMCTNPNSTVRIRVTDESAFITIKGATVGISKYEWEKEIAREEGLELLELCGERKIVKTRNIVPVSDGLKFEIDVFGGKMEGLIVAEIELPETETEFERPEWLGKEVTDDPQYYNSNMVGKE